MDDSVLFTSTSALCLVSVPMLQGATDIAHPIMDASDLIEIRVHNRGVPVRPVAVPEAKRHEKTNSSDKIQHVYSIYVPHVCYNMV